MTRRASGPSAGPSCRAASAASPGFGKAPGRSLDVHPAWARSVSCGPSGWLARGGRGLVGLLLVLLWGAAGHGAAVVMGAQQVRIVTSFPPAYCFTVNVAGDAAEVSNLTSGSAGPHDSQLSAPDLQRLRAADLLVVNGLGLEAWLPRAWRALEGGRRPAVVELAAGLDAELIPAAGVEAGGASRKPEDGPGGLARFNAHVWLDPLLAAHAVTNLLDVLRRADPPRAARYEQNAAAYVRRLRQLDEWIRTELGPVKGRRFVTLHDAFPYFVRRYGLSLAAVIEPAPEVEASPRDVRRVYDAIRRGGVAVIFTEPRSRSSLPRQIARDTGLTLTELDPLETGPLSADMYEQGMRCNAASLKAGLQDPAQTRRLQ